MSEIETKVVKQIEYYFGDINLSRDKHLRQLIENSTEGWVSLDEMLKFPRLKNLTEDKEIIKNAIKNSSSSVIEVSDNGIRRLACGMPESLQEEADKHLDKSVYVKGFPINESIDDIIGYLEAHGGSTMNVFMRRFPKDKSFKGSIFAIFNSSENAEKFLASEEASKYKNSAVVRMWQKDYLEQKKTEYEERHKEKELRIKEQQASKEALLQSRMTKGALIELSFLNKDENESELKGDFSDSRNEREATKNFKTWLTELLSEIAQVSWVEYFSNSGKIIIRMNKENSAESALAKLYESEHGNEDKTGFAYQTNNFTGIVLSDEKEKDYWRNILNEQSQNRKRKNGKNNGPGRKKMRR